MQDCYQSVLFTCGIQPKARAAMHGVRVHAHVATTRHLEA